jgi:dipeptidyl aminopeptidase/acylaminoacyl peptidase
MIFLPANITLYGLPLMKLTKTSLLLAALFIASPIFAETPPPSLSADQLSLKKIMADPDWMGRSPKNAEWTLDSQQIVFNRKAEGHTHTESELIDLASGKVTVLKSDDALFVASLSAALSPNKSQGVFTYQGDIFTTDVLSEKISQLTADDESQSSAQFISDSAISYFEGRRIFTLNLETRVATQIAAFEIGNNPDSVKDKSYLESSQPRLIEYIKNTTAEQKFQKQRREALKITQSKTWYLGKGNSIRTFRLSPDANWLLLGLVKDGAAGKSDHMPEFVTADGYVNDRNVRPLVGSSKPTDEKFTLYDLKAQEKYEIDLSKLPGINDDPLEDLKKKASKKLGTKYTESEGQRAVYAYNWTQNGGVEWSPNSRHFALQLYSYDNKDRWIVGFDTNKKALKVMHWLSDEAWVNDWTFNQFGWLPDNQTLYFLSEESGYSHLYIKKGKRRARQLTEGEFEVSDLTVTEDGQSVFFRANRKHPGIYEIYKIDLKTREIEEVTELGGVNEYGLSPDEKSLIILHSTMTKMPELYLASVSGETAPTKLTDTMSNAFKSVNWQAPAIVEVPSSKIDRAIYSRFYKAQSNDKAGSEGKKPAVIFVHGAGYLQNAHQGWSGYFREFMFHNLLTQQGYVVLDMDYRASKGYGRDWRTAIYQNMGTPELEDLVDGAKWLTENANVDPERIGIYGGSYGGFMTFMALFKTPDVFAAGAALRPVTDWAHYNHGYTSNILNTPEVDPEAYERSSPIEFAEGLKKPLLIAHGMVDDNVFFKDSVRLVQRLIELEKTKYFETAIYPVEPHGFVQPSSWLDEYTRIHQLFERHLN